MKEVLHSYGEENAYPWFKSAESANGQASGTVN